MASSRATNFAALIDLPESKIDRNNITDLIKKITPWDSINKSNNSFIKKAQDMIKEQWNTKAPKVLDPFAGGGAIPLEALRLGCETYASDYNPVAVFIEKATLEWPQKFGVDIPHPDKKTGIDGETPKISILIYLIEKWTNKIFNKLKSDIGIYYPDDPDGSTPFCYIWARTIPCQNPTCGARIPLIRQFWLSKKEGKPIAFRPKIDEEKKKINFEILESDLGDFDPNERTVSRADAKCLVCDQVTRASLTRKLAQEGKMNQQMLVVALRTSSGNKKYRIATEGDIEIYNRASKRLDDLISELDWLDSPIPNEKMPPIGTYGIDAQRYTVNQEWGEIFNRRQLLTILELINKIRSSYSEILKDCEFLISKNKLDIEAEELTKATIAYLSFIIDKLTSWNSTLSPWLAYKEDNHWIFGRQAIPTTWDYGERNLFVGKVISTNTILNTLPHLHDIKNYAAVKQSSATSLQYNDNTFDAIFTDPPYYDNVPYSDLSDFFYVWLKRCLGDYFEDLFSTPLTPKSEEAIAERMRQDKPELFFENMLSNSFSEMYRVLKPNGITTIVYAHKTTTGWEKMLNSLVRAGFVVTASWPLHTEMKNRLRAAASAALASSIYMVCRKMKRKKVGFYSEIQPKIKSRIEEKLNQFWNEGIAGGDFFISAIGPGMEIFSQYEKVEKYSGEQVTTSELLEYIRSVSTDFIVNKLLKEAASAKIDNQSEFYLAFRWTYLDNTVEYDDARKLASASGITLEEIWGPGSFIKKSGSTITVLGPKQRADFDSVKSMVDVMHKCLLLWEKGKKDDIAELLSKKGYADNPAFKQFCQAVAESLLNGNKEKQLLEGFLIGIDEYKGVDVKKSKAQTDLKQYGVR